MTPLTSRAAVVELIAATTTKTGLKVECALDERTYEKGIKISDAEMATLDIRGDTFHPDWNYTSQSLPPQALFAQPLGISSRTGVPGRDQPNRRDLCRAH